MKVIHIPHERKLSFKDTPEPLCTQPELISSAVLRDLLALHNVNTCEGEEFEDEDDELEGLDCSGEDQNTAYDLEMHTDDAAQWLNRAEMLCAM